jgi:bifunctional DNA-binding transcriptional regulator/antitoxin component of YhaV-PrlF toxin-antitoxin module
MKAKVSDGATVRVLPRHQLTLPRCVREDLDARPGDTLQFERLPDGSWAVRRRFRTFLELADSIRSKAAGKVTIAEALAGWDDD